MRWSVAEGSEHLQRGAVLTRHLATIDGVAFDHRHPALQQHLLVRGGGLANDGGVGGEDEGHLLGDPRSAAARLNRQLRHPVRL